MPPKAIGCSIFKSSQPGVHIISQVLSLSIALGGFMRETRLSHRSGVGADAKLG